jgi:hypothetical protein
MDFMPLILAAGSNPLNHAVDHALIVTGDGWWLLSNHVVMLVVAFVLCLAVFIPLSAKYQSGALVPTGSRNFFEAILLILVVVLH